MFSFVKLSKYKKLPMPNEEKFAQIYKQKKLYYKVDYAKKVFLAFCFDVLLFPLY